MPMKRETRGEDAETQRLRDDASRAVNWKRWGPYLSERQWGTVREDYSPDGACWDYFPHDHARSRAYRWGEDGLLGICDRQARVCFALALWNGRDPILKERLFGLTGPEGNHGEDVKECYFYLDATPTHSYLKALYKYPQAGFPYGRLVNHGRGRGDPELELIDTGSFDDDRYFDVTAEYAKAAPEDIAIRITIANRAPEAATVHLLPTVWLRNTWSWGRSGEGYWPKGRIERTSDTTLAITHPALAPLRLEAESVTGAPAPDLLFTENESNAERLWGAPNPSPHVKDAVHRYVCESRSDAVNPNRTGTKAAVHYTLEIPSGGEVVVHLRLARAEEPATPRSPRDSAGRGAGSRSADPVGAHCERVFRDRIAEADAFYDARLPANATADERAAMRQGYAGLLWSKQSYHFIVDHWLDGDPAQPPPPASRLTGRNSEWRQLYNRDVISMPDKWEYPWYAAWDLAFHMLPFARIDCEFAKEQLILFLREWYMHPNGQIPAYEFAFGDVNPPVHAWAAWRVYKLSGPRGGRDRLFLARVFQKLLINFTWWVNRKDAEGNNLFGGGFLGLDNVGVFDRSQPLPTGGSLEQADGTAWMAGYCLTMMVMALELAEQDPAYEDVASKFFEHFIAIVDAINTLGGTGLWDELDGFYYDQLNAGGTHVPLRVRSIAGLIPLLAVTNLETAQLEHVPGFRKRMQWFLDNRPDLARHTSYMAEPADRDHGHRLLALPSRARLERVLRYVLDESEFLSPYGIRSVSRVHREHPFVFSAGGNQYRVGYVPGESDEGLFGGNSNWRGPVWFPLNYLLIEALERYHHFYGDDFKVECPTGSGRMLNLSEVAHEISARLARIVLPDAQGRRPCHGDDRRYADDPHWRDLVTFFEYFHGDTGRGLGASHQTGWTALVIRCLEDVAAARRKGETQTRGEGDATIAPRAASAAARRSS